MRLAFAAVLPIVALVACRDGVPVYEPVSLMRGDSTVRQLTFGSGQDRDPTWSPGGDSVYFHTDFFIDAPYSRGILLAISVQGGVATELLGVAQRKVGRILATPVISNSGTSIAYVDIIADDVALPCRPEGMSIELQMICPYTQPLLDSALIRVRDIGEVNALDLDPHTGVKLAGTSFQQVGVPLLQSLQPLQALHRAEHAMVMRPSWSPDRDVVFSDGESLRIWQLGETRSEAIPGTEGGVSAAWSPDGRRIAYTQLVKGDSTTLTCVCIPHPKDPTVHQRWLYTIASRRVIVIAPDGADRSDLGEAMDPAWSRDGQAIYASRNGRIERIAITGGNWEIVPGTEGGRTPSVSPDGKRLAFSRSKGLGLVDQREQYDWDIWIVKIT